jgi:hypothetical protein
MASPTPPEPRDRKAYLDEQLERQKRGEPIDVEWARAEHERLKAEIQTKLAASERRLRWVVLSLAGIMCMLWVAANVIRDGDPKMLAPVAIVVAMAALGIYRQTRRR